MRVIQNNIYFIAFLVVFSLASTTAEAFPVRALHIVANPLSLDEFVKLAKEGKQAGFNTIILELRAKVGFKKNPGRTLKNHWPLKDFLKVVSYLRNEGIEIVPSLQLLTHQDQFFGKEHPELMFSQFVYDPRNPKVYSLVMPYIDEIIKVMKPKAIHIGHDEAGLKRNIFSGDMTLEYENVLPSKLFLKDVQVLHNYLRKKGVDTWMWGDMLISPDEFPQMLARHFHGRFEGYGRKLRNQLPKDIVICDWHYWDKQKSFPTINMFRSEGFRVLGSTWRDIKTTRAFSHYASKNGAEGMIATTWFAPKRRTNAIITKWSEVNNLVRQSGKVFQRDFPDEK